MAEEDSARHRGGGAQSQVLIRVLEALKEASRNLQKDANEDADLKALLELETESDLFSFDPYLSRLSQHLSQLKTLVQNLRKTTPSLRSFLQRRSSSHEISRVASSIETEIQSWIDRENVENLVNTLRSASASLREDKERLLIEFEQRVSQDFDRELQNVLLKSGVFHVLESVLCDASGEKTIRERAGSAIAALVQFNKDVFVGQVLMGPTIKSLISLASVNSIRALCSLTRSIKSPLVDEIESNGHIPKIMSFLASDDIALKVQAMELVMEIGYFGRREAIEATIEEGIIEKVLEMQRSQLGGNLIDMGRFEDANSDEKIGEPKKKKKSSRSESKFLEKHPFASCVARFSIQLEVGQGLRQSEKRAFKQEILERVKKASASDTEAANILAEASAIFRRQGFRFGAGDENRLYCFLFYLIYPRRRPPPPTVVSVAQRSGFVSSLTISILVSPQDLFCPLVMSNQFGARANPVSPMDPQSQKTSLERLHHVEKRIVNVLELAGGVMDELGNSTGPRMDVLNHHSREFMQSIRDIQMTLREEIKSACEYRPFERCDYSSRVSNEICVQKLEYVIEQLDSMKRSIDQYNGSF
ncbi:hypothetical protein H6P81_008439 [Aristolochia fimbriata]|uniref:Mediator of RNA polymerase II transcription subunit 11 n=1 Tax=Aristolochia fimbriata TaxID=158543 RepID=A0AAV7EIP2_ARIFI|nr:hypothetical protein H6P81_008439 [Aristolochia fimbriata]